MRNTDFDFLQDEAQDDETIEELKKLSRQKTKSFSSVINRKKLSKYDLDDVML